MEASNTKITELPLEIHHEIGSYLTPDELKAVSLVSWEFFDFYSYPLAKKTFTKIEKYLKKTKKGYVSLETPPLRKLLCNIRMRSSMFPALKELDIDTDSVRSFQILDDKELTENVFETYPKLHSLIFLKRQADIDLTHKLKTLSLPRNLKMICKVLPYCKNFQNIVFEAADIENMNLVLENNKPTLKELTIKGAFQHESLDKILPKDLHIETVTIESEGDSKNTTSSCIPAFERCENLKLNMDFNNSFSEYYFNLFPFLTHFSFMFNEEFSSHLVFTTQHLEKTWYLPKLRVFRTNYCGQQYIEKIEAPNLEKLELQNLYNTYTLECLKRFQSVKEICASSHKASFLKTAIECFTQNFNNLKVLEIEQEGLLDDFQINMVLRTVTKFQLNPVSRNFEKLRILGRYLQREHELKDFDLEGYRRESYPHVKKWISEIDGLKVEMVFQVVWKELGNFNFTLF